MHSLRVSVALLAGNDSSLERRSTGSKGFMTWPEMSAWCRVPSETTMVYYAVNSDGFQGTRVLKEAPRPTALLQVCGADP